MVTNAKTIPWKSAPQQRKIVLGDDDTGTIEIPVKLGLTVNEAKALDDAVSEHGDRDGMTQMIVLASDIADKKKLHIDKVFEALVQGDTALLGVDGTKQLLKLKEALEKQGERERTTKATIMLQRLDGCADWTYEDTERQVFEGLEKWLVAFCDAESEGRRFDPKVFAKKANSVGVSKPLTEAKAKKS